MKRKLKMKPLISLTSKIKIDDSELGLMTYSGIPIVTTKKEVK